MDYTVTQTKQIAIVAESPEEAQKKVLEGEGKTISSTLAANPRPPAPQPRPALPAAARPITATPQASA